MDVWRTGVAMTLAAGGLYLAGCASSGPVERRGVNYRADAQALVHDNQLKIAERTVKKTDGLLDVQLAVQNLTAKDIQLEYRFIWRNKAGVVTEVPTSVWMPLVLAPKATVPVKGRAPTPDAEDFLLSLRAGK
jgi:uncharacterized protein YcfL